MGHADLLWPPDDVVPFLQQRPEPLTSAAENSKFPQGKENGKALKFNHFRLGGGGGGVGHEK